MAKEGGHLTALAAAAGKGREVELWSFRLDSGHHQFHFGFEDAASARDFHDALTKQLARLKAAADAAAAAANGGGGAAAGGTSGGGGGGDLMTVESVPMIAAGGRQVRASSNARGSSGPNGDPGCLIR
ncbi:hypothetical protein Rsub_03780 [Raphidocelis subcapitata]|uniref:Uncharacterized protein n=1 Tax=Raphidocelis subcapitata TaxID=307507 RepID=A0A2V0P1F7_9CHLO|nr:hypothetical protein Rsub_03780 [Raphidocelis subcapitata]|eukprot:GBF90925.1 hypothetical protein Rsub_03780 [Raphidocelis subcapitata]